MSVELPLTASWQEIMAAIEAVQGRCRRNLADPPALAAEAHAAMARAATCGAALGVPLERLSLSGQWAGMTPADGSDTTLILVQYGRLCIRRGTAPTSLSEGLSLRLIDSQEAP